MRKFLQKIASKLDTFRFQTFYFYVFLLFIVNFSLSRLLFYFVNKYESSSMVGESFFLGFRFDVLVSLWILIIPWFSGYFFLQPKYKNKFKRFKFILLFSLLTLSLFFVLLDIGWYNYSQSHINMVFFQYLRTMSSDSFHVFLEWKYLILVFLFLLWEFVLFFLLKKIAWKHYDSAKAPSLSVLLIAAIPIFLGLRGGAQKMPIGLYKCHEFKQEFAGSVSHNAVFDLIKIFTDFKHSENENSVLDYTKLQDYLKNIPANKVDYSSMRGILKNKNVVIVLMESMAMHYMNQKENGKNIAPYLQYLSKKSIFFDSCFSVGEHTYDGIFATTFGLPVNQSNHMLKDFSSINVPSLAKLLSANQYKTAYFIPHSGGFDNMDKFCKQNGFSQIETYETIPKNYCWGNNWGAADKNLFDFTILQFDSMYAKKQKFYANILTISNHSPFHIPSNTPDSLANLKPNRINLIKYADYSIQQLIESARKKPWFNETVFVFMADHGYASGKEDYNLPICFHHIPLIIYAPGTEMTPTVIHQLVSQNDLPAALCYLLDIPFPNSYSINPFQFRRKEVYFVSPDYFGALNQQYYCTLDAEYNATVYNFQTKKTFNKLNPQSPEYNQALQALKNTIQWYKNGTQYFLKKNKH